MSDYGFSPEAKARVWKCWEAWQDVASERMGWGESARRETDAMSTSLCQALVNLAQAERVWADGSGYSFGGVMPGGITFGMIAREVSTGDYLRPALEWTMHS